MFFVSDQQDERHNRIRAFLTEDCATIAVILAAIDFEWSVRRAILALGTSPTSKIRKEIFSKFNGGYRNYASAWSTEVEPLLKISLPDAIPHWHKLASPRNGAVRLRGQIVHGARVPVSSEAARESVEDWLSASQLLEAIALRHQTSLFKRIVRRTSRTTLTRAPRTIVQQ
jgi:hypothetical protein